MSAASRSRIIVFAAALAVGAALGGASFGAEDPPHGFGGYLKSYAIGIFPKNPDTLAEELRQEPAFQLLGAARLNGFWRPFEKAKLEFGYEFQPVWEKGSAARSDMAAGALSSSLPLVRGASYRLLDLNTEISGDKGGRDYRLYQNLDRLAVYWRMSGVDIAFGRQAITFGTAKAIQATDVLLPYSFQQLNVEYRIGVDAVRAQIPMSRMSELDVGAVVGDGGRADESAAFIRAKVSDIVAMAMVFSGAKMLGGGMESGIGELGYNLDFAQVWAPNRERYFRLSQGLDYAFSSGLVLFGEYHFNGAGANHASEYLQKVNGFAYQRGGVFLLGRHYFIPGIAYPVTALLSARSQFILNLQDASAFFAGGLEYGASENLYLDLGVFGAFGQPPRAAGSFLALGSEFGAYPVQVYGAVRWYF